MILEPLLAAAGAEAGGADAAAFASLLSVFVLATFIGLGSSRACRACCTPPSCR
jgi:hypothetical protein